MMLVDTVALKADGVAIGRACAAASDRAAQC